MNWLLTVTVDQIMFSLVVCYLLRELMIRVLPDQIAGPGGWLVNTENDS